MDKKSLIYTLATVVEEAFQTKEPAISVASVLEAMSSVASYLCDGLQHDAHELLVGLSLFR